MGEPREHGYTDDPKDVRQISQKDNYVSSPIAGIVCAVRALRLLLFRSLSYLALCAPEEYW